MRGKCIVIGAGDLTVGELQREAGDFVIAVDGGADYCRILDLQPDLILGDFDSVSAEGAEIVNSLEKQSPERVLRLPQEKDDTDMLAALKAGLQRGYRDFRIYGGCGGRLDHTLANIQCLLYLKKQGAVGYLLEGTGMILVLWNEEIAFRKNMKGILSLFSLVESSTGVYIKGMKYLLSDAVVSNDFPVGISNEFIGEQAVISVRNGALACMIQYTEE